MKPRLIFLIFSIICLKLVSQPAIGLLLSDTIITRWQIEKEMMRKAAKLKGYDLKVMNNLFSADLQVEQGLKMLDDPNVKALIVVAEDKEKVNKIVEKGLLLNKPVVAYDRRINTKGCMGFVGFDPVNIGFEMSKGLLNKKKDLKVLVLSGPKKDTNSILIVNGVEMFLASQRGFQLLKKEYLNEWSAIAAFSFCTEFLSDHSVDAIICANDYIASGVIDALALFGIENVLVSGQDAEPFAIENIKNGKQQVTIFKPHKEIANAAIEMADELIKNKSKCTYREKILPIEVVDVSKINKLNTNFD